MILDMMLENGSGTRRFLRERLIADIARLQHQLAALEQQKALYIKMFSLPAGQSMDLPVPVTEAPIGKESPGPARMDRTGARAIPAGGPGQDLRELYATSTLMVYYLTVLAPDKGEHFARYMWGVQQLRDEYDLSLKFFDRSARDYGAKLTALEKDMNALAREVDVKSAAYSTYFKEAAKHANTCGHFTEPGPGALRFTHTPDAAHPPPDPPKPMDLKAPELPSPPTPLLTAAEVKKRREQLLNTLMEGTQPLDFIARTKDAAAKLGLKLGERR